MFIKIFLSRTTSLAENTSRLQQTCSSRYLTVHMCMFRTGCIYHMVTIILRRPGGTSGVSLRATLAEGVVWKWCFQVQVHSVQCALLLTQVPRRAHRDEMPKVYRLTWSTCRSGVMVVEGPRLVTPSNGKCNGKTQCGSCSVINPTTTAQPEVDLVMSSRPCKF